MSKGTFCPIYCVFGLESHKNPCKNYLAVVYYKLLFAPLANKKRVAIL